MIFTDAEHVRQMVRDGRVTLLPVEVSVGFGRYIESLPLLLPLGASVDWSRMPAHKSVDWFEKTDQELIEWARTVRIGRFNHVVVWYNEKEPCLLTEFDYGVANMDVFTWGAPGPRYLFGAETRQGEEYSYSFEAFMEFTGGKLVYGVV
ncbi:hypothetical protein AYO40_06945 [Planctomycetaceae bacterium SCGC AG-212-D15]|nr:hypothetical protein AYO40_06945 [Planctomycetaceae bacterium SCGC AG-212-D15]